MTTSLSRGIVTSMFLRLCSRAPLIMMELFIRGGIIPCGLGRLDKRGGAVLPRSHGACGHATSSEGDRHLSGSSHRLDLVRSGARAGGPADVHLDRPRL